MRSRFSIILAMLRGHIASPYIFLWRTIEVLAIVDLARRHGYDLTDELALDVGCGNGIVGQALVREIGIGLDLERQQLRWALREPAYHTLLQGSATAIPLADQSQHSVFCNCVMEHISDDAAAFAEMARVVAPGGMLLLTLAGADLYRAVFGHDDVAPAFRAELDRSLQHVHYYAAPAVRHRLESLGLDVLATEPYVSPFQARWWYRLRSWEASHPQRGWRRRVAQLLRIPVTLAVVPLLFLPAGPLGAGVAVVARRPEEPR